MNFAKYIDHTMLNADADEEDITKLITEAKQYKFASICINPCWVKFAAQQLLDADVAVVTVVGFPLGANTTIDKVNEAHNAIKNGTDEIDMVINIGNLKSKKYDQVLSDIKAVTNVVHDHQKIIKVIIETCLLADEEKQMACKLVRDAGADFVKTSTGFSSKGATTYDIRLIKDLIGDELKIKASGGIHTQNEAMAMINAGADRLGTSSSVEIIEGE